MNWLLGFFKNLNLKVPASVVAGIVTPIIVNALVAHGVNLGPNAAQVLTPLIIAIIGWLTPSALKKGA